MMILRMAFLPALVLVCLGAQGQDKGELKLYVSPFNGVEYILDGTERLNARGLVLPAGDHRFVFWAPDRQILDTTLTILPDTVQAFHKTLVPTLEYRDFLQAQKRVKHGRFFYRAIPTALAGVGVVMSLNAKKGLDEANTTLTELEDDYATLRAPSSIVSLKSEAIPNAQDEVDQASRKLTTAVVFTSVAVVATVWGFIKAGSLEDPEYEDKGKVIFDGLVWVPGQQGVFQAALTIPIR